MIPLCVFLGDVTQYHLTMLERVKEDFGRLPGDQELTCHDVCEHIARKRFMHLEWVKGEFNYLDHSWLQFKSNPRIIIDVYPWACASGPMLLVADGCSPWRFLYKKGKVQCLIAV